MLLCRSYNREDLHRFLQWVALSARPITVAELAEVITINFQSEERPFYDQDLRYMDPREVLTICSGFLTEFEGMRKIED